MKTNVVLVHSVMNCLLVQILWRTSHVLATLDTLEMEPFAKVFLLILSRVRIFLIEK
jgi:hypothetical protein